MKIHYKLLSACFAVMMSFSTISAAQQSDFNNEFPIRVGPGNPVGSQDIYFGDLPLTFKVCVDAFSAKIRIKNPGVGPTVDMQIHPGQCSVVRHTYIRMEVDGPTVATGRFWIID